MLVDVIYALAYAFFIRRPTKFQVGIVLSIPAIYVYTDSDCEKSYNECERRELRLAYVFLSVLNE